MNNHDLRNIADRVLNLVRNSYIIHDDKALRVTLSVGATLVNEDDTMESLIKRADDLLYKSKASGRNCLTVG